MRIHDVFNRLKRLKLQIQQISPKKVPISVSELDQFTTDILMANDLPDLPEYRRVIATAIMHLGPIEDKKSGRFFGRSLRRALANQAAFDKIQDIVQAEKKKQEALKELAADGSAPEAS